MSNKLETNRIVKKPLSPIKKEEDSIKKKKNNNLHLKIISFFKQHKKLLISVTALFLCNLALYSLLFFNNEFYNFIKRPIIFKNPIVLFILIISVSVLCMLTVLLNYFSKPNSTNAKVENAKKEVEISKFKSRNKNKKQLAKINFEDVCIFTIFANSILLLFSFLFLHSLVLSVILCSISSICCIIILYVNKNDKFKKYASILLTIFSVLTFLGFYSLFLLN